MSRTLRLTEAEYLALKARRSGAAVKRPAVKKPDPWPFELASQMVLAKLPKPTLEYRFAAPRKWRFDLAWPDLLFAVEVDGMVHRIKERFVADLEKHQAAFALNWRVLRVSPAQVREGAALQLVEHALRRMHDLGAVAL